jgi:hypothetical protein
MDPFETWRKELDRVGLRENSTEGVNEPSSLVNSVSGAVERQRGIRPRFAEGLRKSGIRRTCHITTISAWNLFRTLHDLGEREAARAVLERDLRWLLDRDPATLGADQRKIREYVAQVVKDYLPGEESG